MLSIGKLQIKYFLKDFILRMTDKNIFQFKAFIKHILYYCCFGFKTKTLINEYDLGAYMQINYILYYILKCLLIS